MRFGDLDDAGADAGQPGHVHRSTEYVRRVCRFIPFLADRHIVTRVPRGYLAISQDFGTHS
jgi:hypothetical protein